MATKEELLTSLKERFEWSAAGVYDLQEDDFKSVDDVVECCFNTGYVQGKDENATLAAENTRLRELAVKVRKEFSDYVTVVHRAIAMSKLKGARQMAKAIIRESERCINQNISLAYSIDDMLTLYRNYKDEK